MSFCIPTKERVYNSVNSFVVFFVNNVNDLACRYTETAESRL